MKLFNSIFENAYLKSLHYSLVVDRLDREIEALDAAIEEQEQNMPVLRDLLFLSPLKEPGKESK